MAEEDSAVVAAVKLAGTAPLVSYALTMPCPVETDALGYVQH